jgi:FixJ family two-component response regulator
LRNVKARAATEGMIAGVMPAAQSASQVIFVASDPALRDALRFRLELDGYQVLALERGEDLIGRRLPEANACLVLAQHLPGIAGLDVLDMLRLRGVALPAILLAGRARADDIVRAEACGAAVVETPLVGEDLAAKLHELLPI